MLIGPHRIDPPLVLAPMSGVTNLPFRLLCKEQGAGLVCTEFVSANGLSYGNRKTKQRLRFDDRERPVSAQVFGSQVGPLVEAARQVEEAGADLLDLNLGCTAPKVLRARAGAWLLREPEQVSTLVTALGRAVSIPVTVKIRLGWSSEQINAVEIARRCEDCGAAAIAVHGRTATQGYRGRANWDLIGEVQQAVRIPVIGNGDVREPADAERMLRQTGCAGVMIGRGARGNPWVFRRTAEYLRTGQLLPPPTPRERLALARRHGELLCAYKGTYLGALEMRQHLNWYLRGLPHAAAWRQRLNQARTWAEIEDLLEAYANALECGSSASAGLWSAEAPLLPSLRG